MAMRTHLGGNTDAAHVAIRRGGRLTDGSGFARPGPGAGERPGRLRVRLRAGCSFASLSAGSGVDGDRVAGGWGDAAGREDGPGTSGSGGTGLGDGAASWCAAVIRPSARREGLLPPDGIACLAWSRFCPPVLAGSAP